ncbi:MAG TPA: NAD(P)/FAD-dependent oxidoreductase [Chloroflexia bacterium]|nr:NAD(P)/FAD-dependent oxidoreductase [Chloroflexia bacterium]
MADINDNPVRKAANSGEETCKKAYYDVAIIGAGLAGLTLALQLKRARPATSILLIERGLFPRPEAAFKVGESSAEIGAFYLREIIGIRQHLEQEQLTKFGLRFFFTQQTNQDITRRVEAGRSLPSPVATYQLDRGRLENYLKEQAIVKGCDLWEGCKIREIEAGADAHYLGVSDQAGEKTAAARWLVDASGRGSVLKRRFGLKAEVEHNVNAAWFRLPEMIDIENWSDQPGWKERIIKGERWLSTNHLVGAGYWVWLIPLASGSISVGIVADEKIHPFESYNRLDRALDWLQKYEPQCYEAVKAQAEQVQDFKVQKHFALNALQVFSEERWAVTGEAGRFLDPLYSMGSDFIGISNTFITNLIYHDFNQDDLPGSAAFYDQIHAVTYDVFLQIYQHQYPLFGNAQVMLAKLVWDNSLYWGFVTLLFFNRKLADLGYMGTIYDLTGHLAALQRRMQALFRAWNELETTEYRDIFVDYLQLPILKELNQALTVKYSAGELRRRLERNVALLDQLAAALFYRAARSVAEIPPGQPVNPLALSLNRQEWEKEGLFAGEEAVIPSPELLKELELIWLERYPEPRNEAELSLMQKIEI